MKEFMKSFLKRGLMFAWGGPVIVAIVWLCLNGSGVMETLTVNEAVLGVITSTILAFVAAGISAVYMVEKLPKAIAGLIQFAVLYIDYVGIYLLNGWIPLSALPIFTLIFVLDFVVIWLSIYISIARKVKSMNMALKSE